MRIVGRRCDAEDITQEALFRLWRNAPSWKDKELPLRNWLYRITYNLCIDEIRKRKPETPIDEQLYLTTNTSVEKSIYNDEKYKLLAQALARLSEGQRTAIALCTYQGVANRDAASIMDISVDAVESLLSRGRRKLRETLVDIQGTLV